MRPAEKAPRYEAFVSDVLQRDLCSLQLPAFPQCCPPGTRCGRGPHPLHCMTPPKISSSRRPDTSRIFVALGYGFFAELTLTEALRFVERKTKLLIELSESLTKDSAKIKANIRMVLEVMRGGVAGTERPERGTRPGQAGWALGGTVPWGVGRGAWQEVLSPGSQGWALGTGWGAGQGALSHGSQGRALGDTMGQEGGWGALCPGSQGRALGDTVGQGGG
uniref:Uncharacterized protein n=1 Tax=Chrysemys picta bellii TaxID=8478 RepID=A0A8C3IB38_CHRPI